MQLLFKLVILHASEEISFDDAPLQQNVTVDTDALVKCVVGGQPEPKVTWRFAGSRINFSESSSVNHDFLSIVYCGKRIK